MGRVTQLYAKSSQGVVNPITHIQHYISSTAPPFLLFRGKVNVVWCMADGTYLEIGTDLYQFFEDTLTLFKTSLPYSNRRDGIVELHSLVPSRILTFRHPYFGSVS